MYNNYYNCHVVLSFFIFMMCKITKPNIQLVDGKAAAGGPAEEKGFPVTTASLTVQIRRCVWCFYSGQQVCVCVCVSAVGFSPTTPTRGKYYTRRSHRAKKLMKKVVHKEGEKKRITGKSKPS